MNPDRVRASFMTQLRSIASDLRELDQADFDPNTRDELVARLTKTTDELNDFCKHLIGEQAP